MTALYLYDDAIARRFEPFASTRPISEMAAGTSLIRERWMAALQPESVHFLAGPRHVNFDEAGARAATGVIPSGSVIANARCMPALPADLATVARRAATCSMWQCEGELAAVRTKAPLELAVFADGTLTLDELSAGTGAIGPLDGWWLSEVWDFIRLLPQQLTSDIEGIAARARGAASAIRLQPPPPHSTILGGHSVLVNEGPSPSGAATVIEPLVVFDASAGPILVEAGTHIRSFTRLVGPCYIGPDVQVMGGDISGSSVGGVCKVRGELSSSILLGHANKGHDGFVGHSYLGRWVNLGAGTITSNLKNTYGSVSLWTPAGIRETGMQFLGTLFGDHVKTGIGLRLTTGTVLGAAANVYGTMPPKAVAPFAWGDGEPYSVYRADKFVETAARVMARRQVALTDCGRAHLQSVHAARWTVNGAPR